MIGTPLVPNSTRPIARPSARRPGRPQLLRPGGELRAGHADRIKHLPRIPNGRRRREQLHAAVPGRRPRPNSRAGDAVAARAGRPAATTTLVILQLPRRRERQHRNGRRAPNRCPASRADACPTHVARDRTLLLSGVSRRAETPRHAESPARATRGTPSLPPVSPAARPSAYCSRRQRRRAKRSTAASSRKRAYA